MEIFQDFTVIFFTEFCAWHKNHKKFFPPVLVHISVLSQDYVTILQSLVKTDVTTKKCLTWSEDGCFPSEPVFVRNPAGTKEDDGMNDCL